MIKKIYYKILYLRSFLRNCRRYASFLWHDEDYDHSYLLMVMEIKLSAMATRLWSTRPDQYKTCRIAAHLCKRLNDDNYSLAQMRNKVPEHDQKMLGRIIGRHLACWWD